MPASGFPVAIMLFAIAFSLFDSPPNILLKRYFRPSLWIGFLLFSWGALTLGFAGVQNYATVVVLRFLIGVFEAGAGPAVCYLISGWYRKEERGLRIALYIASTAFAGAFGGCVAYGAGHLNGVAGLQVHTLTHKAVRGVIAEALMMKMLPVGLSLAVYHRRYRNDTRGGTRCLDST